MAGDEHNERIGIVNGILHRSLRCTPPPAAPARRGNLPERLAAKCSTV